jgi:hypothetical protein
MRRNRSILGFFLRIRKFFCWCDLSEKFQRYMFEKQLEEGKRIFGIFRDREFFVLA